MAVTFKEFAEELHACNMCGYCVPVCPADIPFDGLWDDVKETLVKEGLGPLPEHLPLLANVKAQKNLYGSDNETRDDWFEGAGVKQSPSPEVLFWGGCNASC